MKKFLSIFITVAMVLSFAGMFAASPTNAPVAKAFPTGNDVVLTTSNYHTPYTTWMEANYTPNPDDPMWVPTNLSHGDGEAVDPTTLHVLNSVSNEVYETYKMGQVIYGYITDLDTTQNWTAVLARYDSSADKYYAVDVLKQNAGIKEFSLQTGNTETDGEYLVLAYYGYSTSPGDEVDPTNSVCDPEVVYVAYNMQIVKNSINFNTCSPYYTLKGFLTRGNGQTIVADNVRVAIAYPNGDIAAAYWIQPNSSGMFTLTFPAVDPDHPADGPQVGKFYIYVLDEYDGYNAALGLGEPDTKDMFAYYWYSNIPKTEFTLSTYISPTLVYKNVANQPVLLVLKDQDGNPVEGANITATYNTTIGGVPVPGIIPVEVSPGVYRIIVDTMTDPAAQDIRFTATKNVYGKDIYSNTVIINLRELSVFNPYVDVWAVPNAKTKIDVVQTVYDKLSCTIGYAFWIKVDSWPMPSAKKPDWHVVKDNYWDTYWGIKGDNFIFIDGSQDPQYYNPYLKLGHKEHLLITKGGPVTDDNAGKISVSIHMLAWQRANTSCPAWDSEGITEEEMSTNACCKTFDKTFDICKVSSCTYGGVTLTGSNVAEDGTVEVGKKVDQLSVSIDPKGRPADLTCSCPYYVVAMYMVDKNGELVDDAFTADTYGGVSASGSMIWYNPQHAAGPGIDDQPITHFQETGMYAPKYDNQGNFIGVDLVSSGLEFGDCPFTLNNITFNYPTGTSCGYSIVVKVFGLERTFDSCGMMNVKWPLIAEDFDPFTVTPESTTLNSTYTITEGSTDPDQLLAGVLPIIDITDPGFSYESDPIHWNDIHWVYYLNGSKLRGVSWSSTDNGYRFTFNCPLDDEGTFEIVGYSYNKGCTKKEVVVIDIPVVKPEFTVQIGLSDGSVINNDSTITEGITENIYVKAVDPRDGTPHDFSTDSNWTLKAYPNYNKCEIPTSHVCFTTAEGCTTPSPISVTAYGNPNVSEDPTFDLYFVAYDCAYIDIDTFTVKDGAVRVDPTEVPFTIPASATHVTVTVTDAHKGDQEYGHGIPDVEVQIGKMGVGSSAAGYSWSQAYATTNADGEADFPFVPPTSGKYTVYLTGTHGLCETVPCGWGIGPDGTTPYVPINGDLTIVSKYKAPTPDTEAPVITLTAPADGATVATDMVTVKGTVTDNVGVTSLYIGSMKVDFSPAGSFSANCALSKGENTLKVFAFDAAGNKAEKDITVTYKPAKKTVVTVQIGSDVMTVNGGVRQLDTTPVIHEGHTYLPLRAIAEALGAKVDWIADTKGITLTLGDSSVGLQIGNVSAVVDGNVVAIFPPYMQPYGDGTYAATMVPLRVIAEGLGAEVTWDPATRVVTITLVQP